MSRKTEEIEKTLNSLFEIVDSLKKYNEEKNDIFLENLGFDLNMNLKNLEFLIESLYAYNGKSTSLAKQKSSRENGKKGGRPPKIITELRKRKKLIENELLPEIQKLKNISLDFENEEEIINKINSLQNELLQIDEKLSAFVNFNRLPEA